MNIVEVLRGGRLKVVSVDSRGRTSESEVTVGNSRGFLFFSFTDVWSQEDYIEACKHLPELIKFAHENGYMVLPAGIDVKFIDTE